MPDTTIVQGNGVDLTAADLAEVDRVIRQRLRSDVTLINQIATYIIGAGGKRIRPRLVLLFARALGHESAACYELAAIVEFIHTATLLHDDVVDESSMRRGRQTANALFGNAASVLVGDFLYSRAFQMMVSVGSMRVLDVLADATNVIAEGEVLQLLNAHDPETSEQRYLDVTVQDKGLRYNTDLLEAVELGFLLDLAEVLVVSARARNESRGGHFREDYPNRDDVNFMRHTMAYREVDADGDTNIRLDYKPVTVTRYQPMERKY